MISDDEIREIAAHARNMRRNIIKMIFAAGSGHPAGALGLADIYATLFFGKILRENVEKFDENFEENVRNNFSDFAEKTKKNQKSENENQKFREKNLSKNAEISQKNLQNFVKKIDENPQNFSRIFNYDFQNPRDNWRDFLVISNGHTAAVFYAALAEIGAITEKELLTFRKFGSRLQGHPEREKLPFLETTSGPLGEGLSQAAGMAYALKNFDFDENFAENSENNSQNDFKISCEKSENISRKIAEKNDEKSEKTENDFANSAEKIGKNSEKIERIRAKNSARKVFCFLGDGELDEGENWEAAMFAAKNHLSNLIAIVDFNNIQIDGKVENVMPLEPLAGKFAAFNWRVSQIDGNNIREIFGAFLKSFAEKNRPTVILAKTVAGKGVKFMENDFRWHGKAPNKEEAEKALSELVENVL